MTYDTVRDAGGFGCRRGVCRRLRLMRLPRTLGVSDGEAIVAANGRFGPFLKKGAGEYRSLTSEDELFTVTLEQAVALFAQPRTRRGQGASAAVGTALGEDENTGKPVQVKTGRFGPYVTDGETNATLPKGTDPAKVTLEQASQLLADKRAKGPAPKRTVRRAKAKG